MTDSPTTAKAKPPKPVAKKAPGKITLPKVPAKAPTPTAPPAAKASPKKAATAKVPAKKTPAPTKPAESSQSDQISLADNDPLYVFRIDLKGIKPRIWREFYVPADTTLLEFHRIISDVMGWYEGHLFYFVIYGCRFYNPSLDSLGLGFTQTLAAPDEDNYQPLDIITLDSLGLREGAKFQYMYDLGDNWEHVITVKNLNYVPDKLQQRRGCLRGARACPPEDCGGVNGYKQILQSIADLDNKGLDDDTRWLNEDYDPEDFDLDDINECLA
ncbi:MAG: plasmid pRiA4b ORF-3 family protein [Deltaproteobacteria bacterium]|jgi:hypothetical protein|nr:plasmid pRiA4b ORF-3 family protein [Deltaproteobacteria bacterium]